MSRRRRKIRTAADRQRDRQRKQLERARRRSGLLPPKPDAHPGQARVHAVPVVDSVSMSVARDQTVFLAQELGRILSEAQATGDDAKPLDLDTLKAAVMIRERLLRLEVQLGELIPAPEVEAKLQLIWQGLMQFIPEPDRKRAIAVIAEHLGATS